jgi:hypothetical protein
MLPKPLYESLPALYIGAGVVTVTVLHSAVATVSAVLFIAAGARVWVERSQYRHRLRRSGDH